MRSRGWGDEICQYSDFTVYTGGPLPSTACDARWRGIVCGPGCGDCAAGQACFGLSEAGPGLCVSEPAASSPLLCGGLFARACTIAGRPCARFVMPRGSRFQDTPGGLCFDPDTCHALAAAFPTRFQCP